MTDPIQPSLFDYSPESLEPPMGWPAQGLFPHNYQGEKVGTTVDQDLYDSRDPLVITGYTSLHHVVRFLATCWHRRDSLDRVRILLGHEPTPTPGRVFLSRGEEFSQAIRHYWTERGISLYLSSRLIAALELLRTGKVEARISANVKRPVHAKIYGGDTAITIGSSNFSDPGLYWQVEGNSRFDKRIRPTLFSGAWQLAEQTWKLGRDYTGELITLLEQLLSVVNWREALGRACAEILEGSWAERYLTEISLGDDSPLWPSQTQGIAQALWVIESLGSVLLADATGSGKTRLGARLMRGVIDRIWSTGRIRRDISVLVCPPLTVEQAWKRDFIACGVNVPVYSHGILSRQNSAMHDDNILAIRRAQVLGVDEAHNFLNRASQRTRALFNNSADHVLLFTATPINRSPLDLMAIIDLLGADNFDDEVLEVLERIWRRRSDPNETVSAGERKVLRNAVRAFTVRRTKATLNQMIDQQPDQYRDSSGKPCRYPEHKAITYLCHETAQDLEIAAVIREQSKGLRGLTRLQSRLQLSKSQRAEGLTEDKYLHWRLNGSAALAAHLVMASLRSSRAALTEHLRGTAYVQQKFSLSAAVKKEATGHIIEMVRKLAGHIPEHDLHIPLPRWLTDPDEHRAACMQEIAIYEEIGRLADQLTNSREEAKAQLLIDLLKRHQLLIAFDNHLITLHIMRHLLQSRVTGEVIIATGDNLAARKRVNTLFQPGSTAQDVIALCSDAMSEGVNLQAASVVVHLDMPSVMRLAEQRVGRVDRMNSPHRSIEVYWPGDAREFALRTDELFYERHRFVADLLGSNMPLPEHLIKPSTPADDVVTTDQMIAELEALNNTARVDDDQDDAFAPVRALVSGSRALMPAEIYETVRTSSARILSSVSAVEADTPWAFFAVAGSEWGAPRWVFLESASAQPITDLERISELLRARLRADTPDREYDDPAARLLAAFLDRLIETEYLLLPRKKQRALQQMPEILTIYRRAAATASDDSRAEVLRALLTLIATDPDSPAVDLSRLADAWSYLVRPYWYRSTAQAQRNRPHLLRDLKKDLLGDPLPTDKLREVLHSLPLSKPLAERIVAAVVGVA